MNYNPIQQIHKKILRSNSTIIDFTGAPGTGKTTTVNELLKINSKYTHYTQIRKNDILINNKNFSLLLRCIFNIPKNINLIYILLKNVKTKYIKKVFVFYYWCELFAHCIRKKGNKILLIDESLFQRFYVYGFHNENIFININELINLINSKYYIQNNVSNILIKKNKQTVITNRLNRKANIDLKKNKQMMLKELEAYNSQIEQYTKKINYVNKYKF